MMTNVLFGVVVRGFVSESESNHLEPSCFVNERQCFSFSIRVILNKMAEKNIFFSPTIC